MKLYNTLSKQVEHFTPLRDKVVNFFVCGPTVYDYSHLGHAKTYIQMDTLARFLRSQSYELTFLMNITDIDDKIIARSKENHTSWQDTGKKYEEEFHTDMKSLNVCSVDEYPQATDFIDQIIDQVQRLQAQGHAYAIPGDGVYFEISTFEGYGKLSRRREVQENDAQSRIDESSEKRGWNDFCLWKFSKEGEPTWNAPFGAGRPGWHIEDTAIAEHYFGPQYDIHGGAIDLIFPHHEAELTQMESLSNKAPFVKYWVHTGFLTIRDEKMSKSTGNFYTIREIIDKGIDPIAIRLLMLQSHYRSALNFDWPLLDSATNRLRSLRAMADLIWQPSEKSRLNSSDFRSTKKLVVEALNSDLNTPEALKHLSSLETKTQQNGLSLSSVESFGEFLVWADDVFGLDLSGRPDITNEQKGLIKKREKSRNEKDWATSDGIRDDLAKQGILLNDTEKGVTWSRV